MAAAAPVSPRRKLSLAQTEVSKFRRAFAAVDTDRDGLIHTSEIQDVAHRVGYRLSADKVKVR